VGPSRGPSGDPSAAAASADSPVRTRRQGPKLVPSCSKISLEEVELLGIGPLCVTTRKRALRVIRGTPSIRKHRPRGVDTREWELRRSVSSVLGPRNRHDSGRWAVSKALRRAGVAGTPFGTVRFSRCRFSKPVVFTPCNADRIDPSAASTRRLAPGLTVCCLWVSAGFQGYGSSAQASAGHACR
jgi:hypothetical protein